MAIDEGDEYFEELRRAWAAGLRDVFSRIPEPNWKAPTAAESVKVNL